MTRKDWRLWSAHIRYVGADVLASRRRFFLVALVAYVSVQLFATLRAPVGESSGSAVVFMLALWITVAPFCRSWVDDDVRSGYAAFWLQKPVRPLVFYGGRVLALVFWGSAVTAMLAVGLAPAALVGLPLPDLGRAVVAFGWMPVLLVVLSFTGSAAGARNGALVAYGVLFAGLGLDGLSDALALGPARTVLELLLPPIDIALDAAAAIDRFGWVAAVLKLWPVGLYTALVAALGLALTATVPARLGRAT